MTRCRCADDDYVSHSCRSCGATLVADLIATHAHGPHAGQPAHYEVQPCGACLQEAAADAIASFKADREPMIDESRD